MTNSTAENKTKYIIHKAVIEDLFGYVKIVIQEDAELLDIQLQNGKLVCWYQFEAGQETNLAQDIELYFATTGNEFDLPEESMYRKTIQVGDFVIHVYQLVD